VPFSKARTAFASASTCATVMTLGASIPLPTEWTQKLASHRGGSSGTV
jgi:hypothetical protein